MPPAQVSLVARDGVQATGRRATAPGVSQAPTVPGTVIDEETVRRFLPPFRVILHNDDHNSMDHVVRSLLSAVPSLTLEDAASSC